MRSKTRSRSAAADKAGASPKSRARPVQTGKRLLLVLVLACLGGLARGQQAGTTVAETYREAYDFGYRDGAASGANDRKQGKPYDLANKKDFQQAERGLDPGRHDREVFLVAYRRGFEDGYEKGYGLDSKAGSAGGDPPLPPKPVVEPRVNPPKGVPPPASHSSGPLVMDGQVPLGTELLIELQDELSTRSNERGDPFRARVARDVSLNGKVLVPRGAIVSGSIAFVKRAGRIRGRAQMNLKFEELRFPDGRVSYLEAALVGVEPRGGEKVDGGEGTVVGESSRGEDAKTVAGSSGIGALIGLVVVGRGGAGAGAAAGAVAGLASVLVTRGRDAHLEAGTQLTIKLTQEVKLSPSHP